VQSCHCAENCYVKLATAGEAAGRESRCQQNQEPDPAVLERLLQEEDQAQNQEPDPAVLERLERIGFIVSVLA